MFCCCLTVLDRVVQTLCPRWPIYNALGLDYKRHIIVNYYVLKLPLLIPFQLNLNQSKTKAKTAQIGSFYFITCIWRFWHNPTRFFNSFATVDFDTIGVQSWHTLKIFRQRAFLKKYTEIIRTLNCAILKPILFIYSYSVLHC